MTQSLYAGLIWPSSLIKDILLGSLSQEMTLTATELTCTILTGAESCMPYRSKGAIFYDLQLMNTVTDLHDPDRGRALHAIQVKGSHFYDLQLWIEHKELNLFRIYQ